MGWSKGTDSQLTHGMLLKQINCINTPQVTNGDHNSLQYINVHKCIKS